MLLTIRLYAINHSFVTHKSMVCRYKTIVPYLTFVTLTKNDEVTPSRKSLNKFGFALYFS